MGFNKLGDIELDGLESETSDKDANIIHFSIPKSDSNEAQTFDFAGAERTIRLTGVFVRSTIFGNDGLKSIADKLNNLINGDQNVITYSSTILGDVTVRVNRINLKYEAGVPLQLKYEIELLECE